MNYSDGVRLYLFNANVHKKKHSSFQYFFVSEKVEHKLLMAKVVILKTIFSLFLDRIRIEDFICIETLTDF